MFTRRIKTFNDFVCFGGICLGWIFANFQCDALEEYQPTRPPPVLEKWRWTEIELPEGYDIFCGCELSDLNLCFATTIGLLIYDGYNTREIQYPDHFSTLYPYSIYEQEGVGIYIITSSGLFLLDHDEIWHHLFESTVIRVNSEHLFFKDYSGFLYLAADKFIWSLQGNKATPLVELKDNVLSVVTTADHHLFVSVEGGMDVFRIPLSRNGIANPDTWEMLVLPHHCKGAGRLFLYEETDEVFSVSYHQVEPALKFDRSKNEWVEVNVGEYSTSHSHMSGDSINHDTSVVFTKTALHFYHKQKWFSLRNETWDVPTNEAFSFRCRNGNVILSGRADKTWLLDLSNDRWHTLSGLNFQCDDFFGNSWFISKDGEVIEYKPLIDKWLIHRNGVLSVPKSIILSDDGMLWASGSHHGVAAVSLFDGSHWKLDLHPPLMTMVGHLSAKVLSDGRVFFASGHEYEVEGDSVVIYEKSNDGIKFEYVNFPYVPRRIVGIAEPKPGLLIFGGRKLAYNHYPFDKDYIYTEIPGINWIDYLIEGEDGGVHVALWEKNVISESTLDRIAEKVGFPVSFFSAHHLLVDAYRDRNLWVVNNDGISRYDGESWIRPAIHDRIRLVREGGSLKQSSDGSIWINYAPREWNFAFNKEELPGLPTSFFQTIKFNPDTEAPIVQILHADTEVMESSNILVKWEGRDRWSMTPKDKLEYSMKVDDGSWSSFEKGTESILLDLGVGIHHVEVRVRDLDGNYNRESESIQIEVIPPLWKRRWVQLTAVCVIALIFVLLVLLIRQRIKHLLDIRDFKLQFFTNISHELRTPLTVIMWPLKKALDGMSDSPERSHIQIAYSNARKMSLLIDQILEFRRIESGKLESHLVVGDLIKSVQDNVSLLLPMAEEKKLNLNSGFSHQAYFAIFDFEKLERIISNLFSNAVKYSFDGDSISLQVRIEESFEPSEKQLILKLEDEGVGIDADKLDQIFEPFFRVKLNAKIRGMGLGLALVKNLVESMSGSIQVESPAKLIDGKSRGSRFVVTIPFQAANSEDLENKDLIDEFERLDSVFEESDTAQEKKLLMLVEDSKDIRTFIASEFESEYNTIQCENGRVAYKQAVKTIPDLIITDIMMPEMSGNELIQKIRSNAATRHIPIVALTALKSEGHELKSLNLGADDYIIKPASLPVLRQKVRNLIHARQLVIDQYQQTLHEQSASIVQNSIDDDFLQRCKVLVDTRMNDPLFDIEAMANEFAMSRMSLYRKFKAITGDSPGDFVRELKMQRAATLLSEKIQTVSEISDLIGFNDVPNFSKAFKKRFGMTPTQYRVK